MDRFMMLDVDIEGICNLALSILFLKKYQKGMVRKLCCWISNSQNILYAE